MRKLYITMLLAAIFVVGAATVIINTKSIDEPMTYVTSSSWGDEILNNSLLADGSESIILGHVIKVNPAIWNTIDGKKPISTSKMPASKEEFEEKEKERRIYADAIIKVDKKIKNESTPSEIVVRTLGGNVGDDFMLVEDEAKFEVGEKVLLFLTKEDPFTDNSAGTHYRVTGWKFGKFSITNDNQALRPNLPESHKKISLEELLNSIGAQ
ncbi:MAG: hypothetical protein IBX72_15995 [Nitrospirae bacterium]|nr:hypothetical protein [Nitrospirota bacterium]